MTKTHFFGAVSTIVGTVIGAGVLGIPYVIAKSGLIIGLVEILIIGLVFALLGLFLAEVVLRTKEKHQLTGYANFYLGKAGKYIMFLAMSVGVWTSLAAYSIGSGEILAELLNGSPLIFSLLIFSMLAALVFFGLNVLESAEKWMVLGFMLIIFFLVLVSIPFVDITNMTYSQPSKIFFPLGVIFFAFMGATSIPLARELLGNKTHLLKKSLLLSYAIITVLYALFAFVLVGVTGLGTTEVATIGLGQKIGPSMVYIGNLLALFTMGSSFIARGFALKEMFHFDLNIRWKLAWFFTMIVPFFVIFSGATGFVNALNLAGGFEGGITGVLIVLIAWRAIKLGNRKPEFIVKFKKALGTILLLVFTFVFIYQLLSIFNIV